MGTVGTGLCPGTTTPSPSFHAAQAFLGHFLSGHHRPAGCKRPPHTHTPRKKSKNKKTQPLASALLHCGGCFRRHPPTLWPCADPTPQAQPSQLTLLVSWILSFPWFLGAGLLVSHFPEIYHQDSEFGLPAQFSPCSCKNQCKCTNPGPHHHSGEPGPSLEHGSKDWILPHYLALVFVSPTELELRDNVLFFYASSFHPKASCRTGM